MSAFVGVCAFCLVVLLTWTAVGLGNEAAARRAMQDDVRIQCVLHRDDPDVHRICIDGGWDK